jgi:hypothetical protein
MCKVIKNDAQKCVKSNYIQIKKSRKRQSPVFRTFVSVHMNILLEIQIIKGLPAVDVRTMEVEEN